MNTMEHHADKKKNDNNLENIQQRLEECTRQAQEYLDGWKRSKADFINYKKEEQDRLKYYSIAVSTEMIKKLLPVLDSLDEAIKYSNEKEHFTRLQEQLFHILAKEGLTQINEAHIEFDPHIHEAIEMVDGEDSHRVVEVLQKGYMLHNILLRPAKVKVNK